MNTLKRDGDMVLLPCRTPVQTTLKAVEIKVRFTRDEDRKTAKDE